jgi:sugar O-acyltransferase (sialic acid O-acetyltransferase NeuD family)
MRQLIIYGAGGHGQEVAWIAKRTEQYKVIGFFDDFLKSDSYIRYPVFNDLSKISKNTHFAIALGEINIRKKVVSILMEAGFEKFPSIIDPSAVISNTSIVENGVIVFPNCVISMNVKLRSFCNINVGSTISHRSIIGNYSNICPHVTVCGDATVDEDVFVGAGAVINDHVSIGRGAIIGSGSVVIHNLIGNSLYVGNPAKFKKELGEKK